MSSLDEGDKNENKLNGSPYVRITERLSGDLNDSSDDGAIFKGIEYRGNNEGHEDDNS